MDEDEEMRLLHVEATVNLNVDIYQEQITSLLDDVYVLNQNTILQKEPVYVESLVVQNQSKCKIVETLAVPELKEELLQICTASGKAQVERVEVVEEGISIEGIVAVDLLYIKGDEGCPYASWQGMVPFVHVIECGGAHVGNYFVNGQSMRDQSVGGLAVMNQSVGDINYTVDSHLEQVSITMAGSGEIEIKAVVNFQSFIRKPQMIEVINQVEMRDFTREEIEAQAGIIGYIFKQGDSLWELAKKYHTTVEGILKNNKISENDVNIGRKLLIFKENVSIL